MEPYPTLPEPPMSLPIRMAKKRQRTKTGIIVVSLGTLLLAGGGYNFTVRGSELIAGWLTVMAVAVLSLGISLLVRASKTA